MAPSFISLPHEIISMILAYLPPEDILCIGLTYKHLNIRALSPIGRRYKLETRYIMVEKRNLANPVNFSTVPDLTSSAQKLNIHPFALSPFEALPNPWRSLLWAERGAGSKFLQSIIPFIHFTIAACMLQVGELNISIGLLAQDARCIIPSLLPLRLKCSPFTSLCCIYLRIDGEFSSGKSIHKLLNQLPALSDFTLETCSEISSSILWNVTIPLLKRLAPVMERSREGELEAFLLRHATTLTKVDLSGFMTKNPTQQGPIVQFIIEKLQVPCLLDVKKSRCSRNGGDHQGTLNCPDDDAGLWV